MLKINRDKTEKVTKDPKRVEAAHKGREKYMNKLKESISNDTKKGSKDTSNASNETTSTTNTATSLNNTTTTRSSDAYVYGLGILAVLFSLKIQNLPMKNRINHPSDVIYFRKIYNKTSSFDWKKNIEHSIIDGTIITATTTRIFFALKLTNVKLPKASLDAWIL